MATTSRLQDVGAVHWDSESDDFSDYEDYRLDLDANLCDIKKSALKYLNYTTDYVRKWNIDEGFRETYQN